MFGVVFFFRQVSTFKLAILTHFFISFKKYCYPERKLNTYFTSDSFSKSYGGLNIAILAILANFGQ